MDDAQRERFKRRLLQLQDELQETAAAARESSATVELDQSRVGRLSRMDAMQRQQMSLESERRRQQLLKRIGGALLRMDTGHYGSCFICGELIEIERLQSDPTVTRCIDCVDED